MNTGDQIKFYRKKFERYNCPKAEGDIRSNK